MGMDTNIKPPESLAEGSDYLFHSREWTAVSVKFIKPDIWLLSLLLGFFLLFTWMCLMETSDVRNQLVYSREGGKLTSEREKKHNYFCTKNFMDLKSTILTLRKCFVSWWSK